jgi:twitching motility protein PilI
VELLEPTKTLTRRFVLPDEALVSSPEAPDEMLFQRRGCRIGNVCLLISHEVFGELVPRAGICALPNVEDWCLGLVNVRGNLVPVFDMHALLDAGDGGKGNWVLVLGQGQDAAGISVDDLPERLLLKPDERMDVVPDPPTALSAHVTGGFRHEGRLWFEFDYQTLFEGLAKQVGVHAA